MSLALLEERILMTEQVATTISDLSVSDHDLTVLAFYRGEWCPFCQAYLRELDGTFRERVIAAGGRLVGVTSQSAEAAQAAHDSWGLHFDVVSDPSTELAQSFQIDITPKAETPLADHPTEYPNGMSQSGMVVLDRDGAVLYHWAVNPTAVNLFGASDRPLPDDVWAAIEAAMAGAEAPETSGARLDPAFLEERYPEQHASFMAFAATVPDDVKREMGLID
jgi:peroxiredoxin